MFLFLFFLLIIELLKLLKLSFFLIPAVIEQIFNPMAEIVIPIATPTKEAKAEIETHPVITEAKIRK